MKNNVVSIDFSNGFGNNLFQYIYARLIAESHGSKISVSKLGRRKYDQEAFSKLGIEFKTLACPGPIKINDKKASLKFLQKRFKSSNFLLHGYFEKYELYTNYIDRIKTWFPKVEKRNNNDLVFHLRLGDRLFYHETHNPNFKIDASKYLNAINQFDFDKLHIVTDMQDWKRLSKADLEKMKFHRGEKGGSGIIGTGIGIKDIQIAVDHFNSIYDALCHFEPIVRYGHNVADDFNYIRSFDKILFQHGTMGWWASMLSEASEVSVYKHWRPQKGKKNKNLSQVKLSTWHHWS